MSFAGFTGRARVAMVALAFACGAPGPGPDAIAADFWDAVGAGELERAKSLSTAPGTDRIERLALIVDSSPVSIGRTLHSEEDALVECTVEPEDASPVTFNTRVVRFEEGWRVDADATARALLGAQIATAVEDVERSLGESGEALGRALREGAREASEAMQEALEELQRSLEEATPPSSPTEPPSSL